MSRRLQGHARPPVVPRHSPRRAAAHISAADVITCMGPLLFVGQSGLRGHSEPASAYARWPLRCIDGSFGNVLPRALLLRFASEALMFRPLPAILLERLSHC